MTEYGCVIDLKHQILLAGGTPVHFIHSLGLNGEDSVMHTAVKLSESVTLPPYCQMQLPVIIASHSLLRSTTALLEPDQAFMEAHGVVVTHSLFQGNESNAVVLMLNPCQASVVLQQGERVGVLNPVAGVCCAVRNIRSSNQSYKRVIEGLLGGIEDLTSEETEKVRTLLWEHKEIISCGEGDIGHTTLLHHTIDTGNAQPIRQRARWLPYHQQKEVCELLNDMLSRGIIEPSQSPWASPIVLVKKRDGSVRFCVDFRKLNNVSCKDAQPLPRIDDTLDSLEGACYFSTLDLSSGYWQVAVGPNDKEKTAFVTPFGLYQFRVMPFGLCNAPATFQRLMECVLKGLHWTTCLVYLDDIIAFSKTVDEHIVRLKSVFARLKEAGLKIKPSKCHFLKSTVRYLGHVISKNGVQTDQEKVKCVYDWPVPQTQRELQSFLGLASYYRRFVKIFAHIASPLHALSNKGKEWVWTAECNEAFFDLKKKLVSAPILAMPDFSQHFILDTDASGEGLGAVLSQCREGQECVVAYASRSLSRTEKQYCATRRELLALVWASRHFRPYLYGRKFIVRTDHHALRWLHNFKEPAGQVARWLEQLAEFDYEVVHRQGKQHTNADALSRGMCKQCGWSAEKEDDSEPSVLTCQSLSSSQLLPVWTAEELMEHQAADADMSGGCLAQV